VDEDNGHYDRFIRFGRFISDLDTEELTTEQWSKCFSYDICIIQNKLRKLSVKLGREFNYLRFRLRRNKFGGCKVCPVNDSCCGGAFPRPLLDRDTASKFAVSSGVPLELITLTVPLSKISRTANPSSL